jgi:hypothetical protein
MTALSQKQDYMVVFVNLNNAIYADFFDLDFAACLRHYVADVKET